MACMWKGLFLVRQAHFHFGAIKYGQLVICYLPRRPRPKQRIPDVVYVWVITNYDEWTFCTTKFSRGWWDNHCMKIRSSSSLNSSGWSDCIFLRKMGRIVLLIPINPRLKPVSICHLRGFRGFYAYYLKYAVFDIKFLLYIVSVIVNTSKGHESDNNCLRVMLSGHSLYSYLIFWNDTIIIKFWQHMLCCLSRFVNNYLRKTTN